MQYLNLKYMRVMANTSKVSISSKSNLEGILSSKIFLNIFYNLYFVNFCFKTYKRGVVQGEFSGSTYAFKNLHSRSLIKA